MYVSIALYILERHLPNTKHDKVAVNILDAIINIACDQTNSLSLIALPTLIANTATMKAATNDQLIKTPMVVTLVKRK